MKAIKNKETELEISIEKGEKATYGDLIGFLISEPKKEGFTPAEMKQVFKILAITDKNQKVMQFEDADFNYIKNVVKNKRWPTIHKDIVEFTDEILNVK